MLDVYAIMYWALVVFAVAAASVVYWEICRYSFDMWLNAPGRSFQQVNFPEANFTRREAIRFAGVPILLRLYVLWDLHKRQPRTKVGRDRWRRRSKDYYLTLPVDEARSSFTRPIKLAAQAAQ